MEEHTLSEKIGTYERIIKNKPLSILPNILYFAYLSLANKYDEILDYAMQFSMDTNKTNILIEDFRLLAYIGKGDIKNAKTQAHYNFSIDPEDAYTYLLNSVIQKTEGKDFLNEIKKAYLLLAPKEKKILMEKMKVNDEVYKVIKNLDITTLTIQKIQEEIIDSSENSVFELSILKLSSVASLLKAGKKDEAEVEVMKVLNLYPYYGRALYSASEIAEDPQKKADYIRKLFEGNPLSFYLEGKESMFLQKDEKTMLDELRKLFENNNPFITFFQRMIVPKEMPKKVEEETNQKETIQKEIPVDESLEKSNGFDELKNKKYVEALMEFIRMLKKEAKQ